MSSLRYLSVCSGMEAASVAWHPLGWTPVGFSEIEPFPCAILSTRFPNTPNYGSLTEYKQWPLELGAIDLLVGGTPCQSFSVAGLRKGLDDPRGNLALVFLGLADKLKPRWIVWENVPGVLSSNGGRDLGSFLGALVQLGYGFAMRVLDAQHFGVPQRRRRVFVVACLGDWRAPAEVLLEPDCVRRDIKKGRAKGQGVAAGAEGGVDANGLQRTVGTLCADTHPGAYSGQDAYSGRLIPAIKSEDTLQPYTASSFAQYAEGVGTVRASGGDLGGGSETLLAQPRSHWDGSDVHPTLNQSAKGSGGVGASNQELFSQGGAYLVPGQAIAVDGYNQTLSYTSQTIRADKSDGDHVGMVLQPIPIQDGREIEKNQNGMGVAKEGDPAYTIDTTGAQAVGQPIAIQGTIIGRSENAGPQGVGATEGGPMFTLTKADIHGVCYCSDVAPTVTSSGPPYSRTGNERVEAEALAVTVNIYGGNKRKDRPEGGLYVREEDTSKCLDAANGLNPTCSQGGTAIIARGPHAVTQPIAFHATQDPINSTEVTPCVSGGNKQGCGCIGVAQPAMAVRRLTPVECERLQGFPDNWSRISWKGKPEDQCPDGPRYKACGNSMAVPVMRWIGERILTVNSKL